jgi:hypothetical protein
MSADTITIATNLPISYAFTPISPPSVPQDTITGINNLGEIAGYYHVSGGGSIGFTYDDGSYATFGNGGKQYFTGGVNDLGQIVGYSQGIAQQFPAGFLCDGSTFHKRRLRLR